MGIFDRLQYDYDGDGILNLSSNVISFMNTVPSLLEPWQMADMANNNVGGYHTNPVSGVTQTLRNTCNNLVILLSSSSANIGGNLTVTSAVQGTTPAITSLFTTMNSTSANIGGPNGGVFIEHTNRVSGVTPFGASPETGQDVSSLPHYQTALGTGQMIMYLTRQSDNIANNAPIMGSFTSVLIEKDLDNLQIEISTYESTINNSITISSFDDGNGNVTITRTSNLSYDVVSNMTNNIVLIDTTLAYRRVHDERFYQNSRTLTDEYAILTQYSEMGETANNLCQNYVGSEKLLTRINS